MTMHMRRRSIADEQSDRTGLGGRHKEDNTIIDAYLFRGLTSQKMSRRTSNISLPTEDDLLRMYNRSYDVVECRDPAVREENRAMARAFLDRFEGCMIEAIRNEIHTYPDSKFPRGRDVRVVPYSVQIIRRHEVAFSGLELASAVFEARAFDDVGGGRTERINGGCSGSDANAAPTFVGFLDGVVRPGFRHLERGNESRAERLGEGHNLGSLRCVIV